MNSKIIQNGNAFYETDDECMEKKTKASSYKESQNSRKNNSNFNRSNQLPYKSSRK